MNHAECPAASGFFNSLLEQFARLERQLANSDPLHDLSRFDVALASLRRRRVAALMSKPGDIDASVAVAKILELEQDYVGSRAVYERLIADDPQHLGLRASRMRANEQLEDAERMLEDLDVILTQSSEPRFVLARVKALRRIGRFDEAGNMLKLHLDSGVPKIAAEYVRNYFFEARFDEALERGRALVQRYPGDIEMRLYMCAASLELRQFEEAERHLRKLESLDAAKIFGLDLPMLAYAVHFGIGEKTDAVGRLNGLFNQMGCQNLEIDEKSGRPIFDSFRGIGPRQPPNDGYAPVYNGPRVSVIMTAYNMENYVETAVNSILNQSYANLEVIVVDDRSTDRTPEILRRLEARNPRMRAILKTTNDGTYVCKNIGLLHAHGEYIALQDSDDWSHPDRIAKSIAVLEARPHVMGLTTDWLRMTTDGDMVIKAGGQIVHVSCISLVFRRKPVMDKVGFFDSVRIEADMEYIRRMTLVFGPSAVPRLRWPLLFGRAHSASLTASEEFGLTRTGYTEPRRLYQAAYKAWHKTIVRDRAAPMPFPLNGRIFDAPSIMLP